MATGQVAVRLPVRKLLLVLGLVATLYAAALAFWGEAPPGAVLQRLLSWTGLQAALLCLLNYLLRGLRWRLWMAHSQRPLGLAEGLRLYVAGYALTPTPGNVGEAVRGLWLAKQPLGTAQSLALFGAERLADLLGLVLMALPALGWLWWQSPWTFKNRWPWAGDVAGGTAAGPGVAGWLAVALVALMVLMALTVLSWRRRAASGRGVLPARWAARLGWWQPAWACLSHRPAYWLALTLTAWAAQGLAVALLCADAGLQLPALLAAGLYAVAMVGGALSALPAGLGGTEALLVALLVGQGAAGGTAVAVTVLTRLLTLWLAVALGLLALLYSAAIRHDIRLK